MTAVNLDGLYLNDAERPSEMTAVAEYEKRTDTDEEIAYLARDISDESAAWLAEHAGRTVCLRDREGGKVFGILAEISPSEETLISARKVPFSEAV